MTIAKMLAKALRIWQLQELCMLEQEFRDDEAEMSVPAGLLFAYSLQLTGVRRLKRSNRSFNMTNEAVSPCTHTKVDH